MTTASTNAHYNPISPVNVEERRSLGIQAGDTVRVHQKVTESSGKTRIQMFEGIVLAVKHGTEAGGTFTVRRVVDGSGVEKIFPLYSPMIDRIEILRRARVRRSKLYYIRDKAVRQIKRQMRRMIEMDRSTESEMGRADREAKEAEALAEQEAQKVEEESKKAEEAANVDAGTEETPEVLSENTEEETAEEKVAEEVSEEASREEVKEEKKEE